MQEAHIIKESMLLWTGDNCKYCDELHQKAEETGTLLPIKLNAREHLDRAKELGIKTIPTLYYNGQLITGVDEILSVIRAEMQLQAEMGDKRSKK
ncbi:MAG: hypothetical protein LBJ18_03720 [Rickettsiales bacterium]|jgi:glutaredoxin|nr:hypothetical protein [Rickettsiales bacterium]